MAHCCRSSTPRLACRQREFSCVRRRFQGDARERRPGSLTPLRTASCLGLLVGVLCGAVSCGGVPWSSGPAETTLQKIQRKGVVRIGYANEAPFGYQDPSTGDVTGEAPEIARRVLGRMGIRRVEGSLTDFAQLIPGLKAGRFDLIAAGMYITPPRCRRIEFSNPTYAIGGGLLVRKGNPKNLHSFQDVKADPSAILGVVGGTVDLQTAERVGIPESQLAVFSDKAIALAGLQAGRIDAFAGTELTVKDLAEKAGGEMVQPATPFEEPGVGRFPRNYGAFGFRKQDDAFRHAFNRHLADFIGSEEHLELIRQFGFSRQHLPGSVTAEELCRPD